MSQNDIAPDQAALKSPPWFRRLWFQLILLGLLFGTGLLAVIPHGIGYALEDWLKDRGARTVTLGDVDFNPFTGEIFLYHLKFTGDGERVSSLVELGAKVAWWPLWRRRLYIERLTLAGLRIELERMASGELSVGGLTIGAEGDGRSKAHGPWRVGIGQAWLRGGWIEYRRPHLNLTMGIDTFTLANLKEWEPAIPGDLALSGDLQGAPINVEGEISPFQAEPMTDLLLRLKGLDLGLIPTPAGPGLKKLDGAVSADIRVKARRGVDDRLSIEQAGPVKVEAPRISHSAGSLAGGSIRWKGEVELALEPAKGLVQVKGKGLLNHGPGVLRRPSAGVAIDHQGLTWEGSFDLKKNVERMVFTTQGTLRQPKLSVQLAGPAARFHQETLDWRGRVKVTAKEDNLEVEANGALKVADLLLSGDGADSRRFSLKGLGLPDLRLSLSHEPPRGLALQHGGSVVLGDIDMRADGTAVKNERLAWQGEVDFRAGADETPQELTLQGNLKGGPFSLVMAEERLRATYSGVAWDGRGALTGRDLAQGLTLAGELGIDELNLGSRRQRHLLRAARVDVKGIAITGLEKNHVEEASFHDLYLSGSQDSTDEWSGMYHSLASRFTGIRYVHPDSLSFDDIEHQDLRVVVLRDQEGGWNMVRFMDDIQEMFQTSTDIGDSTRLDGSGEVDGAVAAVSGGEETVGRNISAEGGGLGLRIARAGITGDSRILLTDRGVTPAFQTTLNLGEFEVTEIDSGDPERPSKITVRGKIGKHADISMQGSVQPFGPKLNADLSGGFEAVELPPMSAYTATRIGYGIKSGQLDAEFAVGVKQDMFEGGGTLHLHNLEVVELDPEKLKETNKGTTVPLKTALNMLRDKHNTITLKVPVSGDINSPDLDISDAINQAIGKAAEVGGLTFLTAALQPFGALITVVKIASEKASAVRLDPVIFEPGEARLTTRVEEYLAKVAGVLKKRPEVYIRVCGTAVEADRAAMAATATRIGAPGEEKAGGAGGETDSGRTPPPIKDARLQDLARQRAGIVKDHLIERRGVKAKRLVACEPTVEKADAESKPRADLMI